MRYVQILFVNLFSLIFNMIGRMFRNLFSVKSKGKKLSSSKMESLSKSMQNVSLEKNIPISSTPLRVVRVPVASLAPVSNPVVGSIQCIYGDPDMPLTNAILQLGGIVQRTTPIKSSGKTQQRQFRTEDRSASIY